MGYRPCLQTWCFRVFENRENVAFSSVETL